MAPFNMRCNVCGEYIYKGKKFNSRKENVDDEDFLGLRIFRFYIRCPKCVAEIAFKTDLKNTDYTLEAGATRLFEAEKLAQQMAEQERLEKEAEELNPMKVLENRTKASHREMAQIDELEELREISARHAKVDTSVLLEKQKLYEEHLLRLQQEEEDQLVESIFGSKQGQTVKRLADSDSDSETSSDGKPKSKRLTLTAGKQASELLVDSADTSQTSCKTSKTAESWQKSVGTMSSTKKSLVSLVKKKAVSKSHVTSTCSKSNETSPPAAVPSVSSDVDRDAHRSPQAAAGGASSSGLISGKPDSLVKSNGTNAGGSSALGLLGNYSCSESDDESS